MSTRSKRIWAARPVDRHGQLSIAMTCIGYTIALSISVYILWTFGRTDGLTFAQLVKEMIVLGFPAALGAGAARLLF